MKKITLLFLSIAVLCINLQSQTYIEDKQKVSGKWDMDGSPYIIKGEAIVPAGEKLVIKPGVVIKFNTSEGRDYGYEDFSAGFLRVNGRLIAKGKPGALIEFTRNDNYGYWGVVLIDSEDGKHKIENCLFHHSYYIRGIVPGDNATAALSLHQATAKISNCLFVDNGWNGINCKKGASPEIDHCTFENNNYDIECNTGSNPIISNCILYNAAEYPFYINGGSRPTITFSLIDAYEIDDDIANGGNNILDKRPLFQNVDNDNYRLLANSPGKGVAKKGKDMGFLYP